VLKSTGSAFENFYRDEYTTLVEVSDRIFSTSVDATWDFEAATVSGPDDLPALGEKMQYAAVTEHAKTVTLEIFATDESASVQVRRRWLCFRVTSTDFIVCVRGFRLLALTGVRSHHVGDRRPAEARCRGCRHGEMMRSDALDALAALVVDALRRS
jgi:hypothetical protein